MQKQPRLILLLFVLFVFAGTLLAQETGEIMGKVTDDEGVGLPGVSITATSTTSSSAVAQPEQETAAEGGDVGVGASVALSINDTTKFADWVCCYLTCHEVDRGLGPGTELAEANRLFAKQRALLWGILWLCRSSNIPMR